MDHPATWAVLAIVAAVGLKAGWELLRWMLGLDAAIGWWRLRRGAGKAQEGQEDLR